MRAWKAAGNWRHDRVGSGDISTTEAGWGGVRCLCQAIASCHYVRSTSFLDAYLTALIIGPEFIDPRLWIPELVGPDCMNAPMETTEHKAVQTVVAEYTRISWCLSETPKDYRPRFIKVDAETYDSSDWSYHFLIATLNFSAKQWRPVIRGHAVTGDIIAPIRKLSDKLDSLISHEETACFKFRAAISALMIPICFRADFSGTQIATRRWL